MQVFPSRLRAIYKRKSRKHAVTKSQSIPDYVIAHPAAKNTEIATALNGQGIRVAVTYVAEIKMKMNKAAKEAAVEATAPPGVETVADTLTRDQMKMVAQAIKSIRSR